MRYIINISLLIVFICCVAAYSPLNPFNNYTGWTEYKDTLYTSADPLAVTGGSSITLPNRAHRIRQTQKPVDYDSMYSRTDTTILGHNGDGLNVLIYFNVKPTTANSTRVDIALDIGSGIAPLYGRSITLVKGNGIEHDFSFSVAGYALDTWAANGAKVKYFCTENTAVYNITYVITRTHKAR